MHCCLKEPSALHREFAVKRRCENRQTCSAACIDVTAKPIDFALPCWNDTVGTIHVKFNNQTNNFRETRCHRYKVRHCIDVYMKTVQKI